MASIWSIGSRARAHRVTNRSQAGTPAPVISPWPCQPRLKRDHGHSPPHAPHRTTSGVRARRSPQVGHGPVRRSASKVENRLADHALPHAEQANVSPSRSRGAPQAQVGWLRQWARTADHSSTTPQCAQLVSSVGRGAWDCRGWASGFAMPAPQRGQGSVRRRRKRRVHSRNGAVVQQLGHAIEPSAYDHCIGWWHLRHTGCSRTSSRKRCQPVE